MYPFRCRSPKENLTIPPVFRKSTMKYRLLIVEDEEYVLELISDIFIDAGTWEILCARDGEEALKIARVYNPDIILLDIQLPKLNGYQVCMSLKTDPTMSHIKVLMISGMTQNSDREKAQAAGADGYIEKPFFPTVLVDKVEELLRSN